MGTRGVLGVVESGNLKIGYNHFDSYPSCVGKDNLIWLQEMLDAGEEDKYQELARNCRVVTELDVPTEDEIKQVESVVSHKARKGEKNWYDILQMTVGRFKLMLECGFIWDASEFPYESLHCKWGYIVDFDNRIFEVYRGFNKNPAVGRFLEGGDKNGYFPITLVATYSFNALPSEQEFVESLEGVIV